MYPWQTFTIELIHYLIWPLVVSFFIIYFQKDIRNVLSRLETLPFGTKLRQKQFTEQKEKQAINKEEYNKAFAENINKLIEKQKNVNTQSQEEQI